MVGGIIRISIESCRAEEIYEMNTDGSKQIMPTSSVHIGRRELLRSTAMIAGAQIINAVPAAKAARAASPTVKDRFWLWGHYAGSHDGDYGLTGTSRITPVEAAYYMSIPNVIQVSYRGKPEMPFEQYAIPFRALHEVVWSVVGASGTTADSERDAVLQLAKQNANFSGVIMDDFFTGKSEGRLAVLTVEELQQLQQRL